MKIFLKRLDEFEKEYKEDFLSKYMLLEKLQGWFAYSLWGNSYKLRKRLANIIAEKFGFKGEKELRDLFKACKINSL
ncbi:MAG: hypothetical protein AABY22_19735 [Nanoarchaeota archaeon]